MPRRNGFADVFTHELQRFFHRRGENATLYRSVRRPVTLSCAWREPSISPALKRDQMALIPRGDVRKPRDTGRTAVDESLMNQRVRSVQDIETVDIAYRVQKSAQAFVAACAVFNADNVRCSASTGRGVGFNGVPVRAGMLYRNTGTLRASAIAV
jgi:hypothetical protein